MTGADLRLPQFPRRADLASFFKEAEEMLKSGCLMPRPTFAASSAYVEVQDRENEDESDQADLHDKNADEVTPPDWSEYIVTLDT